MLAWAPPYREEGLCNLVTGTSPETLESRPAFLAKQLMLLEATTGIEPVCTDLQSAA